MLFSLWCLVAHQEEHPAYKKVGHVGGMVIFLELGAIVC